MDGRRTIGPSIALVGLAALCVLPACGDDSTGGDGTTTDPSTSTSGTSAPATDSTLPPGGDSDESMSPPELTSSGPMADSSGTTDPGTDDDDDSSSSGGIPFPCDDPALPVTVEGGGSYETIQAAIDATPQGGVVQICPGEYPETLQIVRDLTMLGAGADQVTILGSPRDFVVVDASEVSLTIADLTVRGGQIGVWVGNADDRAVTLDGVSLEDMTQYGVYVWASGSKSIETTSLDVVDSNVSGLDATGDGAGIYVERLTATITDSTIVGNRAGGNGGGLRLGASQVTVTGGQIHSNEAGSGGGALLESGGIAIDPIPTTLTIVNSDWGAGMALENYETDVRCRPDPPGGSPTPTAGFLGANANAECDSVSLMDCCLAP